MKQLDLTSPPAPTARAAHAAKVRESLAKIDAGRLAFCDLARATFGNTPAPADPAAEAVHAQWPEPQR